jgi:hypothetical protein
MTSPLPPPSVSSTTPQEPKVKTEPGLNDDVDMMNGIHHHAPTAPSTASANNDADAVPPPAGGVGSTATIAPAPPPTRKDRSLREFLDMMEEYAPIVCSLISIPPRRFFF